MVFPQLSRAPVSTGSSVQVLHIPRVLFVQSPSFPWFYVFRVLFSQVLMFWGPVFPGFSVPMGLYSQSSQVLMSLCCLIVIIIVSILLKSLCLRLTEEEKCPHLHKLQTHLFWYFCTVNNVWSPIMNMQLSNSYWIYSIVNHELGNLFTLPLEYRSVSGVCLVCECVSDQEGYQWRSCRPAGWDQSFSADSSVAAVWAVLSIGPTVSLVTRIYLDVLLPYPAPCESTHQHTAETTQNGIVLNQWLF